MSDSLGSWEDLYNEIKDKTIRQQLNIVAEYILQKCILFKEYAFNVFDELDDREHIITDKDLSKYINQYSTIDLNNYIEEYHIHRKEYVLLKEVSLTLEELTDEITSEPILDVTHEENYVEVIEILNNNISNEILFSELVSKLNIDSHVVFLSLLLGDFQLVQINNVFYNNDFLINKKT
jgi:hypothetical protein